jgi:lysine 2,3-aminomutase
MSLPSDPRTDLPFAKRGAPTTGLTSLKSLAAIQARLQLELSEIDAANRLSKQSDYSAALTPYVIELIKADPVFREVYLPSLVEAFAPAWSSTDPFKEKDRHVTPRIARRYPERVIFKVTDTCLVFCRFCTRGDGTKHVHGSTLAPHVSVTPELNAPSPSGQEHASRWAPELAWLYEHPDIHEVILTGGDASALSPKTLQDLLCQLEAIPHIQTIRIATRLTLAPHWAERQHATLDQHRIWLAGHIDHPAEFTPEACAAIRYLTGKGMRVTNQSVLLKGVNDDPDVMSALLHRASELRIATGYIYLSDPVSGSLGHATSLQEALEAWKATAARVPRLLMPPLAVKTPIGKVLVLPDELSREGDGAYRRSARFGEPGAALAPAPRVTESMTPQAAAAACHRAGEVDLELPKTMMALAAMVDCVRKAAPEAWIFVHTDPSRLGAVAELVASAVEDRRTKVVVRFKDAAELTDAVRSAVRILGTAGIEVLGVCRPDGQTSPDAIAQLALALWEAGARLAALEHEDPASDGIRLSASLQPVIQIMEEAILQRISGFLAPACLVHTPAGIVRVTPNWLSHDGSQWRARNYNGEDATCPWLDSLGIDLPPAPAPHALDLSYGDLRGRTIEGPVECLTRATVEDADLSRAQFLPDIDLTGVRANEHTVWPDGFPA